MDKIKSAPGPLQRKLLFTALLGVLCLAKDEKDDEAGVLWRCLSLFRILSKEQYETVEGVCVAISQKPVRKYRKIKILSDDGAESSLLLSKQDKVKIGYRYRFYFSQTPRLSIGSDYFDAALSSDQFLGMEELGEYTCDTAKNDAAKRDEEKEV